MYIYRALTTFKLEGEVGRLLGEVNCNELKPFCTTPLQLPCPN